MVPFSFIHTADLHLDSPFVALDLQNKEWASLPREGTFQAFENVVRLCLDKQVDFLLIAGDVYDGANRSLRAQVRLRDGVQKLAQAGIHTFMVHGNHDPLDGWSSTLEWPEQAHLFRDRLETIPFPKAGQTAAWVQGISYPHREEKRNLARLFKRSTAGFHIGLLHANVGTDTGHEPYAPCTLDDLKQNAMDYWALGHVHQKAVLCAENPCIVYPGNTQGRSFKETGERGCYHVKVDAAGRVETAFCHTEAFRWLKQNISVAGMETEQALLTALHRALKELAAGAQNRPVIAQLVLTGSGPLYGLLQRPDFIPELLEVLHDLGTALTPSVRVDRIRAAVSPALNLEGLKRQNDFTGELLRLAERLDHDPDWEDLLRRELAPLFEDPRIRYNLAQPDRAVLREWLARAAERLAENLRAHEDTRPENPSRKGPL